ncbi:MAG: ATP synthase F1 subunit gamma [Actinobacteria bacterium]|nr:ATP synthase F1 subunit gamma [Actinomycetota bacterium]
MADQPKVIRKRIKSVESTRKITRTMEMVATAKLKAAQERVSSSGPYLDNLRRLMGDMAGSGMDVSSWPQFEQRDGKRTLVFLVSSNRGLCGGFNTNLVRLARDTIDARRADGHTVTTYVAGKKGASALHFAGYDVDARFSDELLDVPTLDEAEFFLDRLRSPFLRREVDEVVIIYPRWEGSTRQPPTALSLYPIAPEAAAKTQRGATIFEPSSSAVLARLLLRYERQIMFSVLAEAIASEQIARRMAMKQATDNAAEIADELNLQYNKARQAMITKELSEIIGGAEALKG